jgi:hypothetical protein
MTGARRWPLVVIGSSPFVAVWSGWVGLGGMTGFGVVRPLPGIWDGLTLDTAITLPIGVEAYAVYALAVATSPKEMPAAVRRFAWASAAASLALGMGGQVAFHVMTAHGVSAAPWWVTALVSCLPVLVIFAAAVLWHLTARIGQVGEPVPVTVTAPVMTAEPVPAAGLPGHGPWTSTTSSCPRRRSRRTWSGPVRRSTGRPSLRVCVTGGWPARPRRPSC